LSVIYNPYDISAQRGPASFDIPKAFTAHGIWELPKLTNQNRAVRLALGGWQWSGTMSLQQGYPFTVVDCTSTQSPTGAGGTCLIPDVASGVKGTTCDRQQWLNGCLASSSFALPCPVDQASSGAPFVLDCGAGPWEGNAGRNAFRGPGYANVDFSTSKWFHVPWFVGHEGAKLQLRGEFFNLFNRTNLVGPSGDLAFAQNQVVGGNVVGFGKGDSPVSQNGSFGRATGTYNPRQLQIALRLEF
jgi:hypothetical protein